MMPFFSLILFHIGTYFPRSTILLTNNGCIMNESSFGSSVIFKTTKRLETRRQCCGRSPAGCGRDCVDPHPVAHARAPFQAGDWCLTEHPLCQEAPVWMTRLPSSRVALGALLSLCALLFPFLKNWVWGPGLRRSDNVWGLFPLWCIYV